MRCSNTGCYLCLLILQRNDNVVQYRESKSTFRLYITTSLLADDLRLLYFFYFSELEQELSYRKQIARQLRTQYVEGIYDNPVALNFYVKGHSRSLLTGTIG